LLLCPASRFIDPDASRPLPLRVLNALRGAQAKNPGGVLPFADVPPLVAGVRAEQMATAEADAPVLRVAARWHPFVSWLQRHPEEAARLRMGQSVPVTGALRLLLDRMRGGQHRAQAGVLPTPSRSATDHRLSLREEWGELPMGTVLPPGTTAKQLRLRRVLLQIDSGAVAEPGRRETIDEWYVVPVPGVTLSPNN